MSPFKAKLTEPMKEFVINSALTGMKNKEIKESLELEFDLPTDFISPARISQIKSNAKKDQQRQAKAANKTKKAKKEIDFQEQEDEEEEVGEQHSLKSVLVSAFPKKQKRKIATIIKNFEEGFDTSPNALKEILQVNNVPISAQKQVILSFYDLPTVRELFSDSKLSKNKESSLLASIHDTKINRLKKRMELNKLEEQYAGIQSKKSDPFEQLKSSVKNQEEKQKLASQLEKLEKSSNASDLEIFKDSVSLMKELEHDMPKEETFLEQLEVMKELGLFSNDSGDENSAVIKLLHSQTQKAHKEAQESQKSYLDTLAKFNNDRSDALEQKMQLQLAIIQKDQMSVNDWENLSLRRKEWANKAGYVKKDEIEAKQEEATKKINAIFNTVEKIPEKLTHSFDKTVDKLVTGFEKFSQQRQKLRDRKLKQLPSVRGALPLPFSIQQQTTDFSQGQGVSDTDLWELLLSPKKQERQ